MKNKVLLGVVCIFCLMIYTACSSSSKKDAGEQIEVVEGVVDIPNEVLEQNEGGNEWDNILAGYDEYVDNFISLTKRVAAGDMGAMQPYMEAVEQLGELTEQMMNAQGILTPTQWDKFMKIQEKMMNAANEMM